MKKDTEGTMIHPVNLQAALESVTEYWTPKDSLTIFSMA